MHSNLGWPSSIRAYDLENQSYIYTCKISPDFESLKCNNFLSVICIVSKLSSYSYAEIHDEFNRTD